MERSILLYGAYGYTARLLIEEYAPDGAPLTLAGRDAADVELDFVDLGDTAL